MSTPTIARKTPSPRQRRPGLPRTVRRALLIVHIAIAGIWMGLEVALGALVIGALVAGDRASEGAFLQAIEVVAVWPMIGAAALTLASGVVLGLGTKWGLLRYRWVAVKFVLNVVLMILVLVALRPGAHEVAETGRQLAAGQIDEGGPGELYMPPIVSLIALSFATTISVVKPWGRLRRG